MDNNFSDVDRVLGDPLGAGKLRDAELEASNTKKYRPTLRPPMALLQLFDDGRDSYESVRIRKSMTSVGRSGCDVCIPHDNLIASEHLLIKRSDQHGRYQWSIQDTSADKLGLFVRVRRARLRDRSEFIVGSQRILFDAGALANSDGHASLSDRLDRGSIPGELSQADSISCASLSIPLNPGLPKLWLLGSEYWIGRSSTCAMCIAHDPFLAAKHVRIAKQSNGEWHAHTEKVPNGMWVRLDSITVKGSCTFQVGEQRMRLIIL